MDSVVIGIGANEGVAMRWDYPSIQHWCMASVFAVFV